jgi:signal recognition particle subunit SEC65
MPPQVAGPPPGTRVVQPAELKRWTVVYPCYLDANLSTAQGRRLAKSKLVGCGNVSAYDVGEACHRLGLNAAYEPKRHPRADPLAAWGGRIRCELFYGPDSPQAKAAAAEGKPRPPLKGLLATKEQLLVALAREIPGLPNRRARLMQLQQYAAQVREFQERRAKGQDVNPRSGRMSKAEIKAAVKKNTEARRAAEAAAAETAGRGGQVLNRA